MSVLPDVLKPGLQIVFCGTAAGRESAARRAYYAGNGNQFWKTLHEVGLTPVQLPPEQFRQLLDHGLGLTDISKIGVGMDRDLEEGQFTVAGFRQKIETYKPGVVCFNGKKAAQVFFGDKKREYGLQKETLGTIKLFIAPSTSGAARRYWDIGYWEELASLTKR